MTGQHFKEYAETICRTLGTNKSVLSRYIGITKPTFNNYERHGVPLSKKIKVIGKLREFYLASLHRT